MPGEEPTLSELVLGHRRRYTTSQVCEATGVQTYRARRFWRALGFANVPDDDIEFTDGDVVALRRLLRLVDHGILNESRVIVLARILGRATSRLASSHAEALGESLDARGATGSRRRAAAHDLVEQAVPELEALLIYAWHRHLAVALQRSQLEVESAETRTATVGFADLVSFTRLTRQHSDRDLVALINRFEGGLGDLITACGGRLVKSLGDEILFVADKPEIGADIAIEITERVRRRPVPGVRVGLELGTVIAHAGDIYGDTVNLASRLTSLSEPNQILAGPALAAELADHPNYELASTKPVAVRGFASIVPSTLRRRQSITNQSSGGA